MFIMSEDYELSNIVTKGPCIPKAIVEGKLVEKTKDQYTQKDFAKLLKNYKAMHILY